jgi:hypothetical protein
VGGFTAGVYTLKALCRHLNVALRESQACNDCAKPMSALRGNVWTLFIAKTQELVGKRRLVPDHERLITQL